MPIQKHFLNVRGVFNPHKMQITKAIDGAFVKICKTLPSVDDIDIVVQDDPKRVIPELGISGYSPDGHTIFLYFDLLRPHIEKSITKETVKTLAHEAHHCMRWRGPRYGETLFEALITEGLADHFQIEVTGGKVPLWVSAFTNKEVEALERLAQSKYWRAYNHNDWFFGSKDKKIPRWAGYALGYRLVERYLKRTNEKASRLYATASKGDI